MNDIVRPITPDGFIGYDEFNQLNAVKFENGSRISWIIWNPLENICPICNRGWDLIHTSIKDQHYWHDRKELTHKSCFERYLKLREWSLIYNAVCDCHLAFPDGLKERENGYGAAWNLPWYEFKWKGAETFTIVIGKRKRVFHMEIKVPAPSYPGTPELEYRMAEKCFSEESVTKEFGPTSVLVHAWGEENVRAYLKKFVRILGLEKPAAKVTE